MMSFLFVHVLQIKFAQLITFTILRVKTQLSLHHEQRHRGSLILSCSHYNANLYRDRETSIIIDNTVRAVKFSRNLDVKQLFMHVLSVCTWLNLCNSNSSIWQVVRASCTPTQNSAASHFIKSCWMVITGNATTFSSWSTV